MQRCIGLRVHRLKLCVRAVLVAPRFGELLYLLARVRRVRVVPLAGFVEEMAKQGLLPVGAGLCGLPSLVEVAAHVVRLDALDQHGTKDQAQAVQLLQVVLLRDCRLGRHHLSRTPQRDHFEGAHARVWIGAFDACALRRARSVASERGPLARVRARDVMVT